MQPDSASNATETAWAIAPKRPFAAAPHSCCASRPASAALPHAASARSSPSRQFHSELRPDFSRRTAPSPESEQRPGTGCGAIPWMQSARLWCSVAASLHNLSHGNMHAHQSQPVQFGPPAGKPSGHLCCLPMNARPAQHSLRKQCGPQVQRHPHLIF
jgi:hypothetical protein